jgi:hypothetical protein
MHASVITYVIAAVPPEVADVVRARRTGRVSE